MDLTALSDAELIEKLMEAVNTPHAIPLKAELERRWNERLAARITDLTASSVRLEGVTKRLYWLTWALIVFAVMVPIGIEVWRAYHLK